MSKSPPPSNGASPNEQSTNLDFATEVQSDRLSLIWRVTFWISLLLLWLAFVEGGTSGGVLAMVSLSLLAGSLFANQLLRLGRFKMGVWAFAAGGTVAACVPVVARIPEALEITPLVFPLIIFLVGLLLPPAHTFGMLGITLFLTLIAPSLAVGNFSFLGVHQIAGVMVSIVSALLAAQVTGELHQITEWALDNYKRERRSTLDLFEKRQQLQKSLQRSQVLGEKLKDINGQLESAKHFRGQFLANMSHELRTPLNAIIGFSETMLSYPMMYDDVALPEAYQRDLEQIRDSGEQLLAVINDILDLSRVDAGKLETDTAKAKLDPIIDSAMMTAAGLVGNKPIELRRDTPNAMPDVFVDDTRLRQVLLNLLSNAIKFTDAGSVTVRAREEDDAVCISVTDTGKGIPESKLETIFDEFSQVEQKGRDPRAGAGLGLTISRKLLSLMGGQIRVESTHGEGSTFYVTVPIYQSGLHDSALTKERSQRPIVRGRI